MRYNDPSGHKECDDYKNGKCITYKENKRKNPPPEDSEEEILDKYNGEKSAEWAMKNQSIAPLCSKYGTTCTCFAANAVNEGMGRELIPLITNTLPDEYNPYIDSQDLFDELTQFAEAKIYESNLVDSPPYNLTSESWQSFVKNNMPKQGDLVFVQNADAWTTYNHVEVVVGYKDGWPLVVDQGNGNLNIAQPHRIDDTKSNDIWKVALVFLNSREE